MPKKLSHELNNILASIMLSAELLAREPKAAASQKKQAQSIIAEVKKMVQLIKESGV